MAPSPVVKRSVGTRQNISRRGNSSRPSSFPVLPALAATLLLLGVGQAALWWWGTRLPALPTYVSSTSGTASPTTASLAKKGAPLQRLHAPPLPQNIQFGDALGTVVVTFFTDPACGSCRAHIQQLATHLPVKGVRQVYKFWPRKRAHTTPGLLVELARREAVIPAFWKALTEYNDADLSDVDLLKLLEQAGLPLDQQREALSRHSGELYAALTPDLTTAENAELPPPPVVMVDDYVLDTSNLTPASLADYVQKRQEGRHLLREDRLWMMKK